MKYSIRRSIFETNSSSVHVIAIGNQPWSKYDLPNTVDFRLGRFDWDHEKLVGVNQRASYLYTGIVSFYVDYNCDLDRKEEEKLKQEGQLKIHGLSKLEEAKEFIIDTLSEYNINAEFEELVDSEYSPDYWIDHVDSLDEFLPEILHSRELLMLYLFSPDSVIETGNDNETDYDLIPDPEKYESDHRYVYLKSN